MIVRRPGGRPTRGTVGTVEAEYPDGAALSKLALNEPQSGAMTAWRSKIKDSVMVTQSFLSDYSRLQRVPSETDQVFSYIAPGAEEKLAHTIGVMVDEPQISISPESPYKSAKPDDMKAIAVLLRAAIVDRIKASGCNVVDRPEKGVRYVRIGLTDLQLKKKKRKLLAYTPLGFIVNAVVKARQDFRQKIDVIYLTLQGEVLDSVSNDVLGALVVERGSAAGSEVKRVTFEQLQTMVGNHATSLLSRVLAGKRIDCAVETAIAGPGTP
jgi:hypothetical protein